MTKRGQHIIGAIVAGVMLLVFAALITVQVPAAQRKAANLVLDKLSEKLGSSLSIGNVAIRPSGALLLSDVLIIDKNPYTEDIYQRGWARADTVASIGKLSATFSIASLLSEDCVKLNRVNIENGSFHITTREGEDRSVSNLETALGLVPKPVDFEAEPKGGPDLFEIKKVRINNFRFRMNSFLKPKTSRIPTGMNFEDLDAVIDEALITGMRFAGGVLSGNAKSIKLREKSGYSAQICGNCKAGMGKVLVDDFKLVDEWSDLDLRFLNMTFKNGTCFKDFVNRITLETRFRPSTLALKTISFFGASNFASSPAVYKIDRGHILGPVADMAVENFRFTELKSGAKGFLKATVKGLPDVNAMKIDASIRDMSFTMGGASRFINGWSPNGKLDFSSLAPGELFTFEADANGLLNDLEVTGSLKGSCGELDLRARMTDLANTESPLLIRATAGTQSLDAGELLGSDQLGILDFSTRAELLLDSGDTQIVVDSLEIRRATLKGYEYHNLKAGARLAGDNLWARLEARDSNLVMSFLGNADLKPKDGVSHFRIGADINKADLVKLGLINSYESFTSSMSLDANLAMDQRKYLNGTLRVGNIVIDTDEGDFELGDVNVKAQSRDSLQDISINANMLAATLNGDKPVTSLVPDLMNASVRKELGAVCPPLENPETPGNYSLDAKFADTYGLVDRLIPGLYIEDGTTLSASLDRSGKLTADLSSGRIAKGRNFIKDLILSLDNKDGVLSVTLQGNELSSDLLVINSPALQLTADDNRVNAGVTFNGGLTDEDYGDIRLDAEFGRDEEGVLSVLAKTLPSKVWASGNMWNIDESEIRLKNGGLSLHGFNLHNGPKYLKAEGGLMTGQGDSLAVRMANFDLSELNDFMSRDYALKGRVQGMAEVKLEKGEVPEMIADLVIDSLALSGSEVGNVEINSRLDEKSRKILFDLKNLKGERQALKVDGSYLASKKELDASMTLDNFRLDAAGAFLAGAFSHISGSLDGRFKFSLKDGKMDLGSEGARFNDVLARVALTGTPYTIDGPFEVRNDGIILDGISIKDDTGGSAGLEGRLNYDKFKDMNLNARVAFNQLKIIDTPQSPESSFYGHMKASGSAGITGPFNALRINANITTDGDGDIHVPLSGKLSSSRGQLLTYVEHSQKDNYSRMLERLYTKEKVANDMRINGTLNITEGLNAFLEIDKSIGNVISIAGNGRVNLDMRPSKDQFNLNGNYVFRHGKYHFVLPGILEKDLNIKDGSYVMFGGDLMDSQINITATYNLKTSLSTLVSTEKAKEGTRSNVECGITISNKLSSPDLNFFVNVPDLDPSTKALVDGALNTDDKVQKQFVALLLLGTFIPSEQSGVFNGANMLYSNLGEVVSSQMTNILQKLNIPVDLGLKYQENTTGNSMFDVAISTQLFNNRVSVSGNVGNKQYKSGTGTVSTGDVAGDVDIEVKIDKNGMFRVKLFSHSADTYMNFLDNNQRNGIGLSIQKDFAARKHREEANDSVIINITE